MNIGELKQWVHMTQAQNWRHDARADANNDHIVAGRARVAIAARPDALAIVAFANAMPELLDTIERLQKERDQARSEGGRIIEKMDAWQLRVADREQERDAALAEVEREKQKVRVLRKALGFDRASISKGALA